jgi:hypothetical protein
MSMDWQGIEWIMPGFALLMLVVPVWRFAVYRRRIRRGGLGRGRAVAYFAVSALVPVLLYLVMLLALVGLEELAGLALVTEGLARSAVILVGFGLLVWLVSIAAFVIAHAFGGGTAR